MCCCYVSRCIYGSLTKGCYVMATTDIMGIAILGIISAFIVPVYIAIRYWLAVFAAILYMCAFMNAVRIKSLCMLGLWQIVLILQMVVLFSSGKEGSFLTCNVNHFLLHSPDPREVT